MKREKLLKKLQRSLRKRKGLLRALKAQSVGLAQKLLPLSIVAPRNNLDPRPWEAHTRPRDPGEFSSYGRNPLVPAPMGARLVGGPVESKHPHGSQKWAADQVAYLMEASQHGAPHTRGRDVLQEERGSFVNPHGEKRDSWLQTDAWKRLTGRAKHPGF